MNSNERLKNARKFLGLTQEKFAIPIGLNQANIRDLESGKVKISTLHALAIENAHGIGATWLLDGRGDMFLEQPGRERGYSMVASGDGNIQVNGKISGTVITSKKGLFRKHEPKMEQDNFIRLDKILKIIEDYVSPRILEEIKKKLIS